MEQEIIAGVVNEWSGRKMDLSLVPLGVGMLCLGFVLVLGQTGSAIVEWSYGYHFFVAILQGISLIEWDRAVQFVAC
jgi:hypothetical protein